MSNNTAIQKTNQLALDWFLSAQRRDIIAKMVKNCATSNTKITRRNILVDVVHMANTGILDKTAYISPAIGASLLKGSSLFDKHEKDLSLRCCSYKEKEIIFHRVLGVMGFNVDGNPRLRYGTGDLNQFAQMALARKTNLHEKDENVKPPFFSICNAACERCPGDGTVHVIDCRGCFKKDCIEACKFGAFKIKRGGKVEINSQACKNCKACIKACQFGSIKFQEMPCAAACPVDAISRSDPQEAPVVDNKKCILCGKCLAACPFGAVIQKSDIITVMTAIQRKSVQKRMLFEEIERLREKFGNEGLEETRLVDLAKKNVKEAVEKNDKDEYLLDVPIVALAAPSVIGQFKNTLNVERCKDINEIAHLFKLIGFDVVAEVAKGADLVAKQEYEEIKERVFHQGGEQPHPGPQNKPETVAFSSTSTMKNEGFSSKRFEDINSSPKPEPITPAQKTATNAKKEEKPKVAAPKKEAPQQPKTEKPKADAKKTEPKKTEAKTETKVPKQEKKTEKKPAKKPKFMTSSCCASYLNLVKRALPEYEPIKSTTDTPLHTIAKKVKQHYSQKFYKDNSIFEKDAPLLLDKCLTVFISPCLAKRGEAYYDMFVDHVCTLEEIATLLTYKEVMDLPDKDSIPKSECEILFGESSKQGRMFPYSGGMSSAIAELAKREKVNVKPLVIDGITKDSIKKLKKYARQGKVEENGKEYNFVEVMSCTGGCIGGGDCSARKQDTEKILKSFVANSKDLKTVEAETEPTESFFEFNNNSKLLQLEKEFRIKVNKKKLDELKQLELENSLNI